MDHGGRSATATSPVGLSRVLFPIVVLLGLSGIVVGILNSYDHFTVPALTPVFWNIAIIVGLVIGVPRADGIDAELYVYAFSILIATVIQFLLPLPWLRGRDGRLQVVIDWRDPAVRQTLVLMVPITIGLGLINFNAVVDTFFAARLIDRFHARQRDQRGVPPLHAAAGDLLRRGCDGAVSVACAPRVRGRLRRLPQDGHGRASGRSRSCSFRRASSAPCSRSRSSASSTSAATSRPAQTPRLPAALAAFSLGLVFNGFMLMLNRAFFSLQSPWIPTWVALGNLGLNAVLDAAFYTFGIWGLPLATSIVNIAGSGALFVLLRRRLGRLDLRETRAHGRPRASSRARSSRSSRTASGGRSTTRSDDSLRRRARRAARRARRGRRRVRDFVPFAGSSRARGVAIVETPRRPARLMSLWTKTTSATSRSSRTSTTASRRSPIASSS